MIHSCAFKSAQKLIKRRFASTQSSKPQHLSSRSTAAVATVSMAIGFGLGQSFQGPPTKQVLPSGMPRSCCDQAERAPLTPAQKDLPHKLASIVGKEHVLQDSTARIFLTGARLGQGSALCVVQPQHLHEVQRVAQAIVDADCVIVPQGKNTGLTGGSVPRANSRPTVVLSLRALDGIFPIDDGERVVCLAGAGLASLAQFLKKYFPDRESHSTLGSTFLNPTTAAGVALGSGGTQCRKGPAYTERALYLKVVETPRWKEKRVEVVNTLDVEGFEPDQPNCKVMQTAAYQLDLWSRWIKNEMVQDMKYSSKTKKQASDTGYAERLCKCDSTVSRCNADTHGPDCVRSEGKVIILATVHDTFLKPKESKTFWLSFDSLDSAFEFRRKVCLDNPTDLPVSCEYMDRDTFDVIDRSGRVLGNTIKLVGAASPLVGNLWNIKLWVESLGFPKLVDQILHTVNPIFPAILPGNVMEVGRKKDHHIALSVGDYGNGNMERLIDRMKRFEEEHDDTIVHDCSDAAGALTAFRFIAAPSFRTWCIGEGVQGFSVDYALPKNTGEKPPVSSKTKPLKRMRYSHFGCNVVHEDVAFGLEENIEEAKHALKDAVECECGGKLPAEHGHGTEYVGPTAARRRWERMDPLNMLNPGIGGTSSEPRYGR